MSSLSDDLTTAGPSWEEAQQGEGRRKELSRGESSSLPLPLRCCPVRSRPSRHIHANTPDRSARVKLQISTFSAIFFHVCSPPQPCRFSSAEERFRNSPRPLRRLIRPLNNRRAASEVQRVQTRAFTEAGGLRQLLSKSCLPSFPLTAISPIAALGTTSSVSIVILCYFRNSSIVLLNFYFPTAASP